MVEDRKLICSVCNKESDIFWIGKYGKCFMCHCIEEDKQEELETVKNGGADNAEDIICPYCGYRDIDSWKYSASMGDGDSNQITCSNCEKEFEFQLCLDVSYSTYKVENGKRIK